MSDPSAGLTLGFLTVLQDATGFQGGYLVTNAWGRPLEFRLTTAVQPNRVQQILYGATLTDYIHADLIGKTLVEKTAVTPSLIITDVAAVLPLRAKVEMPVIALGDGETTLKHDRSSTPLSFLTQFEADRDAIITLLDKLDSSMDLAEPFSRIREAVTEARKTGAITRAAA
ncbi:hypothetical protein BH11PLA2_BH11PLA2_47480 [soil metagenome]